MRVKLEVEQPVARPDEGSADRPGRVTGLEQRAEDPALGRYATITHPRLGGSDLRR